MVAHSLTITGLRPATRYFFRLTSSDRAGNMGIWPPSGPDPLPNPGGTAFLADFTTPVGSLRDTVAADFKAGTSTGTYVSETGDGELILAPTIATEFSGSAMPSGWFTHEWTPGWHRQRQRRAAHR